LTAADAALAGFAAGVFAIWNSIGSAITVPFRPQACKSVPRHLLMAIARCVLVVQT